jgi:hypothetical protein
VMTKILMRKRNDEAVDAEKEAAEVQKLEEQEASKAEKKSQ